MTSGVRRTEPFGERYASYYDLFYDDKPYATEVGFLEWAFRRFAKRPVRSVLEIGCGTGGHALVLARRGFVVTGIDRSPAMVGRARAKAAGLSGSATFRLADAARFHARARFDAAIAMFAVVSYLTRDRDLLSVFGNVRRHLFGGAPFVFDYWHAPAVRATRPSVRVLVKRDDGLDVLRVAIPSLDLRRRRNTTTYLVAVRRNGRVVETFTEDHTVRFFAPRELNRLLRAAGFRVIKHLAFPNRSRKPDKASWNAVCISLAE